MTDPKFNWDKLLRRLKKQYDLRGLSDAQIIRNFSRGAFPTRACQDTILRDVKRRWPNTELQTDEWILVNFNLGAFPSLQEQEERMRLSPITRTDHA